MNVTLFTFSKKHNSTAVPTGGTSVDVVLKDEAGVLDPIIELHTSASPSAYNYLYIPTFGRYYWLREWTYNRGIWTGSFYVDPMASWKTQIGAQQLYVFRSAAEWDGRIVDSFYPMKAQVQFQRHAITSPWDSYIDGSGFYILGIVAHNEISYMAVDYQNLTLLMRGLFSDRYFESVAGTLNLTPELKTAIDPMQYITTVLYIPCGISGASTDSWGTIGSATFTTTNSLVVGKGVIDFTQLGAGTMFQYAGFNDAYVHDMYLPIAVDAVTYKHPQQDDRGLFLRSAPYTQWSLWFPPFGRIDLPSDDMMNTSTITLRITVDVRTGAARLLIYGTHTEHITDTIMVSTVGNVAVEYPLAEVFTPGISPLSMASSLMGGIAAASTGNVMGLFNTATNMIQSYSSGLIPHLSMIGSQGSGNELKGVPELVAQYITLADDDVTGRGRPLCSKRLISSIPGYITADPDELSIAASARELEEIRGFISGGFFYE